MGSIIKVEQSSYTNELIDTYASNKVGQYSKYLNLTPTFVTYLAVNKIHSRADTGTGSVNSEIGYNSPLRFNKIIGLPVYNLPVLTPDVLYDESGMDIQLDLSDVVLLPDTVKPTVPDYMVVSLPEGTQVLFRVTEFRYGTIQSNDFVNINLEIKDYGENILSRFDSQIIKTYYTVFENIGTEDKCFIEEENINDLNTLVDGIQECIDTYQNLYWDKRAGGYLLRSQYDSNRVIYDAFLTRFINALDLFPHNSSKLTTMPYMDFNPNGSELKYRRSLLHAIEIKDKKFLYDKMYYYLGVITNPASPLRVFHYDAYSVRLIMLEPTEPKKDGLIRYYDKFVIRGILNGDAAYPSRPEPEELPSIPDELPDQVVIPDVEQAIPSVPNDNEQFVEPFPGISTDTEESLPETPSEDEDNSLVIEDTEESINEQISVMVKPRRPIRFGIVPRRERKHKKRRPLSLEEFDAPVLKNNTYEELTEEDYLHIESYTESQRYILDMIVKFMGDTLTSVDIPMLVEALITPSTFSYFYGPVVIRILKEMYNEFFSSAEDNDTETV